MNCTHYESYDMQEKTKPSLLIIITIISKAQILKKPSALSKEHDGRWGSWSMYIMYIQYKNQRNRKNCTCTLNHTNSLSLSHTHTHTHVYKHTHTLLTHFFGINFTMSCKSDFWKHQELTGMYTQAAKGTVGFMAWRATTKRNCWLYMHITHQDRRPWLSRRMGTASKWNSTQANATSYAPCPMSKEKSWQWHPATLSILTSSYFIYVQTLYTSKASKYLRITISSDFSWSTHVEDVTARGNRTVGFLWKNFRTILQKSSWQPTLQQ